MDETHQRVAYADDVYLIGYIRTIEKPVCY